MSTFFSSSLRALSCCFVTASFCLRSRVKATSHYRRRYHASYMVTSIHNGKGPDMSKNEANYIPLTPLSLFERAVRLYPQHIAYHVTHADEGSDHLVTWSELNNKLRHFASALIKFGLKPQDVVSVLAPNCPLAFDSHFAVNGARGILHCLNIRLDATSIAFQLKHCGSKFLFIDSEYKPLAIKALMELEAVCGGGQLPILVEVSDPAHVGSSDYSLHQVACDRTYRFMPFVEFLAHGDASFEFLYPHDEWDSATLNYTSGTTGDPKGVVYHHRGAYLNCVANALDWNMPRHPRFLWVVPLFHANGWCFPWTLAALGGTSYFLRQIRGESLFRAIEKYRIQYIVGAPITMNTMLAYDGPHRKKFTHKIQFLTAGSPPPPAVIARFRDHIGIDVCTAYGLTEVFGPVTRHHSAKEYDQDDGNAAARDAELLVQTPTIAVQDVKVLDKDTMQEVNADGKSLGEVMIRGNAVMKGYLANERATRECFKGGWFHTGDMAVNHGNGLFEIKDRYKDIIISGGENISSLEVENIFLTHPHVSEAAVVAMKDDTWGEVPAIFVTLDTSVGRSHMTTATELRSWGKTKMASFQAPKLVIIVEGLPKNVTGKVQKYVLRDMLLKVIAERDATSGSY